MFDDRKDAGQQLAQALETYRDRRPLILAIPQGGVEVGCQVARHLNADFSLLIARKLPFPVEERPLEGETVSAIALIGELRLEEVQWKRTSR